MSKPTRTHELFNASDSDVTVESADGVQFLLHRQNLASNTGVFPGAEFETKDEIVHLSEPASVLEIIFQFIYPKRHPKLKNEDFDLVLQVAEATEKYEVFSAMHTCETRLNEFLTVHPAEILIHCLRHYDSSLDASLIDKSASLLARSSLTEVLTKFVKSKSLPSKFVLAWICYSNAWSAVFDELLGIIESIPLHEDCWTLNHCCSNCRQCLIAWVVDLQKIKSIESLQWALSAPFFSKQHAKPSHVRCRYCERNNCKHRDGLVTACRSAINNIPPFSTFIKKADNQGGSEGGDGTMTGSNTV